jgi:hypothetical protein
MAYYYSPIQAAIWQDAFGPDWKPEFPKEEWIINASLEAISL